MKTYMKPEARTIKMVASAQLMAYSGQIEDGYAKPSTRPATFWQNSNDDNSSDESEYSLDSPLWK